MTTSSPDEPLEGSGTPADDRPEPAVSETADRDDTAFARLRAADPAADDPVDVAAIEAAVRDRVPEALSARPAAVVDVVTVPDELAARRRRRAPLLVAAAVAGVLVVGGGGYALGAAGTGGEASDVSTALAPIELGSAAGQQAGQESMAAADSSASLETFGGSARVTPDIGFVGLSGRTVFHQDGLATQRTTGAAWAYDAHGAFSEESVRRVADVLGVEGDVREEYGSYVVGAEDWTGPRLSLQPDGLASVSFHDPTKDPWGCVTVLPEPAEGGAGDTSVPVEPECGEQEHGAPPSGEDAVGRLRALLGDLEVDVDAYELVAEEPVEDAGDVRAISATAYEVVDGRRTGTAWGATYSGAGLSSLYGSLAPRVPLGTYDVVSPAEAVERLGDPRFAGGGPIAWAARADSAQAMPEMMPSGEPETPTVPSTVTEGSPFAWPVTDVTITDAQLGAAVQYQPDGAAVLVPAYELSDAAGNAWSVIAVVDDQLDFSAAR